MKIKAGENVVNSGYSYSKSKVIARWQAEEQLFIAGDGKRRHMRNNLLNVVLADLKEPVLRILKDGFSIKDAYDILRSEKLVPDYVSLNMFYRWRRLYLKKDKRDV